MNTSLRKHLSYSAVIMVGLIAMIAFVLANLGGEMPAPPPVGTNTTQQLPSPDLGLPSVLLEDALQLEYVPARAERNPFFTRDFLPKEKPEKEPEPPPPPKTEEVQIRYRGYYQLHNGETYAYVMVRDQILTGTVGMELLPGWSIAAIENQKLVLQGPQGSRIEIGLLQSQNVEVPK